MNVFYGLIAVLLLTAGTVFGQVASDQPGQARPQVRPRAQAAIEDVVQGLFIAQFQEQVGVSDDQFVKVLPYLRDGIRIMRENADRSLRATNLLRQAVLRNAPEEEMARLIHEVDEADAQNRNSRQAFIKYVDPYLNTAQQARFRVFQSTFDLRLRELVQRARQLNQAVRPQPQQ